MRRFRFSAGLSALILASCGSGGPPAQSQSEPTGAAAAPTPVKPPDDGSGVPAVGQGPQNRFIVCPQDPRCPR